MPRDFYPFVEEGDTQDAGVDGRGEGPCEVHHPARIAVYDDAAAAPRVVVIEPRDVRGYLEEITSTVNRLSHEQGGTIPFMVIREIVENFIHAYFQAPTITILDGGNTIRFSDQGPGIKEKSLALEYGTSSATEEMKHYIRGVGSGLPYAQQYMVDKGGSLEIEDNIAGGTVVTISTRPATDARAASNAEDAPAGAPWPQQGPAWGAAPAAQPWGAAPGPWPAGVPAPQGGAPYGGWQQPAQPVAWPQQAQQPYQQQPQGAWAQGQWPPQQPAWPAATPAGAQQAAPAPAPAVRLDERGNQALAYLLERGSAGPTDLVQAYGSSAATWSRALSALAAQGVVLKAGQKYRLTEFGRTLTPLL